MKKKSLKGNRGESKVWLCAIGLSLGLVMIVGLLLVIAYNGVIAFWPRQVVVTQIELPPVEGQEQQFQTLWGEQVKRQQKRDMSFDAGAGRVWERQFYLGNRVMFGRSFQFVNEKQLGEFTYPEDMMKIERMENSFAIGMPVRILIGEGEKVEEILASAENFNAKLKEYVSEADDKRDQLKEVEKYKIGRINREIEELRVKKQAQNRRRQKGQSFDEAVIKECDAKVAKLNEEYMVLFKESRRIRAELEHVKLVYKLSDGQEPALPVGEIISYYYPNQLSTAGRVMRSVRNVWCFLVDDPRDANMDGGVFPAIFGTFFMTILMSLLVTPLGVIAAIYIHEYAKRGFLLRLIRIAVNNLAGVPSIVFGVFGLAFFVYMIGGTIDQLFYSDRLPSPTWGEGGVLWASLTLAILTLPVVIVATEESLSAVPKGVREASYACGASKWQTIRRVVMPAALPGIITGMILAMARGAGEVAPLMLVGVIKSVKELPINTVAPFMHLDQKFMHLGFHIFDLGFHSPDSEAAKPMVFATTLLLIVLVVAMNLAGIIIRDRLRKKYALGAF